MNKSSFFERVNNKMIFLDGATGSNLSKAGMPVGVCPEKWIIEHPKALVELQKAYIQAGSDIIYIPTFTANRIKLEEYDLYEQMEEMTKALVGLSKQAREEAGRSDVMLAGDITMTGRALIPTGNMELEELIDVYKEQISYLEKYGADILVVETMMSLAECRAALIAAKETTQLPVMVTLTFEPDGRTLYGTDATTAAIVLESLGAAAIGVNCSTGPAKMTDIVQKMASVTNIPIIAKPNAGLPKLDAEGNTVYDMDADTFVSELKLLVDAGASILGGCCGTDPGYIAKVKEAYGSMKPVAVPRKQPGIRFLTSERQTVSFGLDDPFMIVGERINPTGKKALQAELREGKLDKVIQFAEEQESCGASLLDVNMGMGGIDEKAMMLAALNEVTTVSNLPLSLDSSSLEVLEAALRHYPGRALVNSVSLESVKFNDLMPIVAKYGAAFILLPLSDEGLPANLQEKKDIIQKIYDRALSLGMKKEDIIVDGLVQTVGANAQAGRETLETIRFCKENGFATICGLSNISFGLPERSYVNAAFLTMAIHEGLTMAIANPSQDLLTCTAFASDLLLNRENAAIRYIEKSSAVAEKAKEKEALLVQKLQEGAGNPKGDGKKAGEGQSIPSGGSGGDDITAGFSEYAKSVYHAVMKGNKGSVQNITQNALDAGEEPDYLLNEVLIPAINQVGSLFDKGKYFLPQLISSAEAMKLSIELLEPLLAAGRSSENQPVIVIATVEGDIHDIGKNLVAMMLKNYGYQVIDLGKDVPAEEIIRTAQEHDASIICLSALMTTTMQRMKEVIALVKEKKLPIKVMIGGAVTTQEYADEIGADGYSRDAAEAVKVAASLLEKK